jgi:hypothetical protein
LDPLVAEPLDCPQAGRNELLHWRASRPPLTAIINHSMLQSEHWLRNRVSLIAQ